VLRDNGFAVVRPQGARRLYALDTTGLREVDDWLGRYRGFWAQRLDALETEVARGKRHRGTGETTNRRREERKRA